MGNTINVNYNKIYTIKQILDYVEKYDNCFFSYDNFIDKVVHDLENNNLNSLKIFICDDELNYKYYYVAEIYLNKTNNDKLFNCNIVKYNKRQFEINQLQKYIIHNDFFVNASLSLQELLKIIKTLYNNSKQTNIYDEHRRFLNL